MSSYDLLAFDAAYSSVEGNVCCREIRMNDLDAILAIESEAFEYSWSREEFEFCLSLPRCGALVAERDGVVVGYLVYEARRNTIRLLSCAVAASARRSGVGSFLLRELTSRFGSRRSEVVCTVRERNVTAQLFLRQLGFRAQWINRGFYSSAEEDAYRMIWRFNEDAFALGCDGTRQAG